MPLDDNYTLQFHIRAQLDRPVTDEERAQAVDPFRSWGGYVEQTSDPFTRYYTKANIHVERPGQTSMVSYPVGGDDMGVFRVQPHGRLQEWVAELKGRRGGR